MSATARKSSCVAAYPGSASPARSVSSTWPPSRPRYDVIVMIEDRVHARLTAPMHGHEWDRRMEHCSS